MNITDFEPKRVFHYFNEISRIPRGSYNTDAISNYLVGVAKDLGLEYIQDEVGNVIIKVPATAGYENAAPVLLQGHMDMVCTVAPGYDIDMTKEAPKLMVDGDWLTAEGTTLGGDNGIALAMMLAIAESKDIPHPALELVSTVDEETGLEGAEAIDADKLAARKMINLDSEEEGIITVSCAGGISALVHLPVVREEISGAGYSVSIGGLAGGHSGSDIDKELGNANMLLGRVLYNLSKEMGFGICEMAGGTADNVICMASDAKIVIPASEGKSAEDVKKALAKFEEVLKIEYKTSDPNVCVKVEELGDVTCQATDADSTRRILLYLLDAPYGIQNMSMDIEGLVETSLNLGALKLEENELTGLYAIRSSLLTRQLYLQDRLDTFVQLIGGHVDFTLYYPAWEFRKDSPLRDTCVSVYQQMYGKDPAVEAIHAGLECGLFAGKMGEDFDAVSIGPDMQAVHTPDEKLSISSTERVWEYLLEVLKACK